MFTLDVVFAIFLMLGFYSYISYNMMRVEGEAWAPIQTARIGADVLMTLQESGTLQTLDADAIDAFLKQTVTMPYRMRVRIDRYEHELGAFRKTDIIEAGWELTEGGSLAHGEHPFIVIQDGDVQYYCIASWWIWLQ